MKIYSLSSIPYYDSINQCYTKIIVINKEPEKELSKITRRVRNNKLSPFQGMNQSCRQNSCIFAITKINDCSCINNNSSLLCVDEIPELFDFLLNNNYTIDTSITKIMNKSQVKPCGDLICYITEM